MYRHSYPFHDEVRRVYVNVLLQFPRGHFLVVMFLAPLYALVMIHQNFAQFKTSETISDSAECYAGLSVRFESSAACM